MKRDLLARPELADLARTSGRTRAPSSSAAPRRDAGAAAASGGACSCEAGEALAGDAEMRAEINQGLVAVLRSFIADQKSGVSTFIADQVKAGTWGN